MAIRWTRANKWSARIRTRGAWSAARKSICCGISEICLSARWGTLHKFVERRSSLSQLFNDPVCPLVIGRLSVAPVSLSDAGSCFQTLVPIRSSPASRSRLCWTRLWMTDSIRDEMRFPVRSKPSSRALLRMRSSLGVAPYVTARRKTTRAIVSSDTSSIFVKLGVGSVAR